MIITCISTISVIINELQENIKSLMSRPIYIINKMIKIFKILRRLLIYGAVSFNIDFN